VGEKGGFFQHPTNREGNGVMEREQQQGGDREGGGGRFFQRRRPCRFCIDKGSIDFKDVGLLRNFLTERGRIVPRRISGNCMRHQRELTAAVKRARHIALISFAEER
jgi:small subunit ribosomal protein S18